MVKRLALFFVLVMTAAACGGDDGGVDVEGAWARPSPAMSNAGAIYLDVTSGDADKLIGASVDASIAGRVEIHETTMAEMGEGEAGEGELGGAMVMREVGEVALPAGETVSLEPGGLHMMMLDLSTPLELGQAFDVTLEFEDAGTMVVSVEVRDGAP
ncbi:copper chaperone PCu(A)C [bacterium]|nr:copper chaperone PCu(A)C [bacterium]